MNVNTCGMCGKRIKFPDEKIGRVIACPNCSEQIQLSGVTQIVVPGTEVAQPAATEFPGIDVGETPASDALRTDAIPPRVRLLQEKLPLILSSLACCLSLIAIGWLSFASPYGKKLDSYNLSTPESALRSQHEMLADGNWLAIFEAQLAKHGDAARAKEALKTLKIHKSIDHKGKTAVFYTFQRNGLKVYKVEWFEIQPSSDRWFTAAVYLSDVDDDDLKNAIKTWKAKKAEITEKTE